ncbi:EamA family transporter [Parasedimentitalea marina]|uniref:EamA family transporter n=1 Tax=Parasedimentitalea marina TaxID=2483033 RepID=A0A3T0N8A5_9RHOB|nr:DMT family transporter [Parasedimentitalea marina]AZV80192.1 EamA family transporter [Parasedimentitalea marina]
MLILPILAAVSASFGWATGIVLAQRPAKALGAFEFTRIQLIACSAIVAVICSALGYWPSVKWSYWPSFAASICVGIVLGNLAMIECLRQGGPMRTELLLSLKAPLVAVMAYLWLQEVPSGTDIFGAGVTLLGVCLAVFFGGNEGSDSDVTTGRMAIILLLGVTATGFQGFGFLIMKPAMLAGTEPLAASAIRLLGAALLISVIALWPAKTFRGHSELSPSLLGWVILPGFIGYGVSSSLLLYAFANFDAGIAAALGSLSPVLVLPILWQKEGLVPRFQAVCGAILAVIGTAIIVIF